MHEKLKITRGFFLIQFYVILSLIFAFISFLYLDLYALRDDAWIILGFYAKQTSMCLIHITLVNVYVELVVFTHIGGTS